jgi:heptosyltransferase-2
MSRRAAGSSTKRVVVVAPNWLGDAVMSLRAVESLARVDNLRTAVMASAYVARVYAGVDAVDELWVDGDGGRGARIARRARALRAYGADCAVILPPSFSSALAPWLARVPRRVGFRSDARSPLLTHALAPPPRTVHLSDSYARLAQAACGAGGSEVETSAPRLRVYARERDAVADKLARAGVRAGEYVLVVPGAAFGPAKSWPWERYRALCADLVRAHPVVLAGSAADRALCERIAAGLPGVVNLAGATTLGEFFALAEGARVLVANDSGAPHVAAALGVPVVVLFGSTSPAWTAPRGERVDVLQHWVHCNPCFRRTCPTQLECFNGIEAADVAARVRTATGVDAGTRLG